ncbi:substrate-binding domain-containing protein [Haloarchaeobius litoreus]|uniref:Substrate-binding domain-containing protein n=1 Tax=Haloarchaeobius litoreus TaxID=755306 RepID=A0ABD6DIH7_9EURY|nr:substrate-binding domain-containing protein [Haloarchaeobius litoreus]
MPVNDSQGTRESGRRVSRRVFVKTTGAAGVGASLAGCLTGGGGGDGDDGGGGGRTDTQINTEAPEEDITIQWAADDNFADAQSEIQSSLEDAGLPDNIQLEIISGSFTTGDRRNQYNNILNAGQSEPTILMVDNGWAIPFMVRGQLLNLSDALPSEMVETVRNDYFQASVSTATYNGDLYAVPLFADFPTMQYRKDLVEDAGYDPEGENWAEESMSWQRFSEITADVAAQNGMDGFTFQGSAYEGLSCCAFNEFMTSMGGAYFGAHENLFGPIGDRPITVEEQPVVDAIRLMRTFVHGESDPHALEGITGDISPEAVIQYTEEPSREPFTNGEVVMHRNWPYSIVINGGEENFGEDLGVMPIPYGTTPEEAQYEGTGGPAAALGGWHLAINPNASDAKKQAAVQVLRAIMNEQSQLDRFEIGGWAPPVPELIDSEAARDLDVIGRYTTQLRIAGENAVPRPVTQVWNQESQQIYSEVNGSLQQNKAPDQAMSDLASALEQIENSV